MNIHAPNNRAPKYMKQNRIKERNKQSNNTSWKLEYPTFSNRTA